jgi:hypothetical protein
MSDEKKGFDWSFSNKAVDERVSAGRKEMEAVSDKKDKTKKKKDNGKGSQQAPKGTIDKKEGDPYSEDKPVSGKLDTQLFPGRKPPYHE